MTDDAVHADRLCRIFCNVIEDLITARALQETIGDGLSPAQFKGLQYVHLHPGCCIKDLARGLSISHPAAVKLVERLEAKKLVRRSRHERDGRVVRLVVTARGRKQAAAAIEARNRSVAKVMGALGADRSGEMLRCIEAFIRAALSDEKDVDGACLHCGGKHDDDCPVCQAEFELTGYLRRDVVGASRPPDKAKGCPHAS